jgi:hypothetical protein
MSSLTTLDASVKQAPVFTDQRRRKIERAAFAREANAAHVPAALTRQGARPPPRSDVMTLGYFYACVKQTENANVQSTHAAARPETAVF